MSDLTRREFVTRSIAVAVVGACACACGSFVHADTPANAPPVDIGPLSAFSKDGVTDTWLKTKHFLVVRSKGELYALTSICPHRGAAIKADGDGFTCPKHNSHFDIDGSVVKGPAKSSLVHYAIAVDDNKHVLVDLSKEFKEKDWTDPAAFVKIP